MPLHTIAPALNNFKRYVPYAVFLGLLLAFLFAFFSNTSNRVAAQPSTFCYDQTSGATTTLVYMTAGTATTTLTATNCVGDGAYALDSAVVDIEYTASSSNSTLNMRVEHSFDNKDWFPSGTIVSSAATTTVIGYPYGDYRFGSGATTTDPGGSGLTTRMHSSINIPIYGPYIRVRFYASGTANVGNNGALWAQIIGKREVR